ncbi:MAG: hypothetical protein Q9M09_01695 [Mariprofundaceae bacterium]|nr:hypothetical protein [Mariprofundaceae bacterium]
MKYGFAYKKYFTALGLCKVVLMLCISMALLFSNTTYAANPCENILAVEQAFDKNHDGIVDLSDWQAMNQAERMDYARRSVIAAGGQPNADTGKGISQAALYLTFLQQLYRP